MHRFALEVDLICAASYRLQDPAINGSVIPSPQTNPVSSLAILEAEESAAEDLFHESRVEVRELQQYAVRTNGLFPRAVKPGGDTAAAELSPIPADDVFEEGNRVALLRSTSTLELTAV